jgi:ABC-type multidrug transport system fused ATPase/permease subunit
LPAAIQSTPVRPAFVVARWRFSSHNPDAPTQVNREPPAPSTATIVRRLLALGWEYRRRCLTVLGYQVLLLVLGLAGLGLTGLAIDVIRHQLQPHAPLPHWPPFWSPPPGWSPLAMIAAVSATVLVMAAVRAAVNYLYSIAVGHLVQMEIVPHMRAAVYDKLQRMSFRFFDATASGSIINRVTGDVQSVRAFVDQVLIQSLILVLSLGVYLVYMISKHPGLTAACVATTPLLWTAATLFSRWVQPAYAESRRRADRLVTFYTETVQGIRVIKGFAREPERQAAFAEHNAAVRDQQESIFRRVSLFTPTIDGLGQINLVVLLGYGGLLVARGRLTLGDLVVFAGLLQQFAGQVSTLANIVNTLQQSLISARRVFEVLDAPVEVASPAQPIVPGRLAGAVRFEDVHFSYHHAGTPALAEVDFEVAPGQRVVLFGETGSGKTSLLALIPRFYDPVGGQICIDGVDLRRYDLEALRAQVGIVFQESFLFAASIADNLAFGRPGASRQEIQRAAELASAHAFVSALPEGYDTVLEEGGGNLSGGQRQRLAIARAILRDPPILLLDDPTAAVDAETEGEVLEALARVAERRTTIVATHRLVACYGADLILVLEDGRVVERGRHEELMRTRGPYFRAASLQLGGATEPEHAPSGAGAEEASPA